MKLIKLPVDPIDSTEAGRILGMNRESVAYLVRKGYLPAVRFGRAWVFSRKAVEQFERIPRGPVPKKT